MRGRTEKSSCCAAAAVCLPANRGEGRKYRKSSRFLPGFFYFQRCKSPSTSSPNVLTTEDAERDAPAARMLHFAAMNLLNCSKKKEKKKQQAEQPVGCLSRTLCRLVFFNFLTDEVFRVEKGRFKGRVAYRGPETRPSLSLSFIFKSMSISMSVSPPPAINMTFCSTGCLGIDAKGERERALRGANGEEVGN